MLTVNQINELLQIIQDNNIKFIGKSLGKDYLTTEEISRLKSKGINPDKMYNISNDFITQSFHFGLISDAMGSDAKKVTFDQLKEYLNKGKYIPLTFREKASIDVIKKQSLSHIKATQGRIFQDINNVIGSVERTSQEEFIRQNIKEGYINKKTANEIARDIARKTGDWSRNFGRIVETESHSAFNKGRAEMAKRQTPEGEITKIYFDVFAGACSSCIKLYLTNGIGSKPIVFTLEELQANGTNINKKQSEWKATFNLHPHCRCTANHLQPNYEWNEETKRFELKKEIKIEGRKTVKFTFNGKEYNV